MARSALETGEAVAIERALTCFQTTDVQVCSRYLERCCDLAVRSVLHEPDRRTSAWRGF